MLSSGTTVARGVLKGLSCTTNRFDIAVSGRAQKALLLSVQVTVSPFCSVELVKTESVPTTGPPLILQANCGALPPESGFETNRIGWPRQALVSFVEIVMDGLAVLSRPDTARMNALLLWLPIMPELLTSSETSVFSQGKTKSRFLNLGLPC